MTKVNEANREVVLLQRVVYGLRQAGRQWNLRLRSVFLQTSDKELSKAGPCVYSVTWWMGRSPSSLFLLMAAKNKEALGEFHSQLTTGGISCELDG